MKHQCVKKVFCVEVFYISSVDISDLVFQFSAHFLMSCAAKAKKSLRLNLRHGLKQQQGFDKPVLGGAVSKSGNLSPNLQPATPPTYPTNSEPVIATKLADRYLLLNHLEGSPLRQCISIRTQEEFVCKVVPNERYRETLTGHFRLDIHPNINPVVEALIGESHTYIVFPRCYGDLHSYVRTKRILREQEAVRLFYQVASAVSTCHQAGIVLRDLKLRKFVFKDQERTQLKLETLDDCVVLEEDNDWLNDKHGCPAYVSPEILTACSSYSGKAADCWSLGVVLYTMLVGRYPFHDVDPGALFNKIRRGCYTVPDFLSSRAKCLIKSLLRMDPAERLAAEEVLDHPWFKMAARSHTCALDSWSCGYGDEANAPDQTVPDLDVDEDNSLCI